MTEFAPLFSQDAACMQYSAIRRMAKFALHPGIISFAAGAPSAETFPAEDIRRITASILETDSRAALQYGLTLGYTGLIEVVVEFCRSRRSINAVAEEVCITSGSQQALDLVGRLFLDPGDAVFLELPSYIGAISAFRNLQAELVGVRQEPDGMEIQDLVDRIEGCQKSGRRAKLIYVIPNFQNPSGLTTSQEKRRAILEVAQRFGLLVVEDDPYGDMCFDPLTASGLAPMKSADVEGRVIYLSTFSKILAAGLRVGWIVAAKSIIAKVDLAKQSIDLCGSMLDQRIVAECCRQGVVERHLPKIRKFYKRKCQTMLDSLDAAMPPVVQWTRPAGGLFVWAALPDGFDSEVLLTEAIEQAKVTYVPGHPFHVNGAGRNTLRLAFSKESEDNIRAGIHRLAQVFKHHLE
ncbi:MAG: PLP-dependent aminotransferase family protein [Acidobacteria bacterium]|nr:PLP-dependent aminotransferase family protein [Acidobacteriota bacterium]